MGMQRQGKSELTKWFIRRRSRPVLIVNPLDEKYPGLKFAKYDYARPDLAVIDYILKKGFTISQPINLVTNDPEHFHNACEIVKRHKTITLVLDEIDQFDSPNYTDPSFFDLINYGAGHYEADIITTSRRPADISKTLRSQTQEWYIFRIQEPGDKDYLKKIHKDFPRLVESLPFYYYVFYNTMDAPEVRPPISI